MDKQTECPDPGGARCKLILSCVIGAVMLLLVKCYDKKQRFRCLMSGHLTIGQAIGA